MSVPGETYEQWLERTGSTQHKPSTDAPLWDYLTIVLLGLYFLWVGGSGALIGVGIVAVLVGEQLKRFLAVRSEGPAVLVRRRFVIVRGVALLVTAALALWFAVREGGEAAVLPLVLVLDDLKNNRSFLRFGLGRLRGREAGAPTDRSP